MTTAGDNSTMIDRKNNSRVLIAGAKPTTGDSA
jgi:hypothetical protein